MAHVSEMTPYKGVLSRNGTYKADARGHLNGTGIYNNVPAITAALQKIVNIKFSNNQAQIAQYNTQYGTPAQRAPRYTLPYTNPSNGQTNFESNGFVPYLHQAHHIIPVEVFYDDKWQAYIKPGKGIRTYLQQVKWSNYDINNAENMIYLPQVNSLPQNEHICEIHQLPDHSSRHVPHYNDDVVAQMQDVYDMIEEAADKTGCDAKKLRGDIYNRLKELEEDYYDYLVARGRAGTGSSAPGRLGKPSMR